MTATEHAILTMKTCNFDYEDMAFRLRRHVILIMNT